MRKSQKQNLQLPKIQKHFQVELNREDQIIKPKLNRIFYSPLVSPTSPNRLQSKMNIMNAFLSNRNYQEVKDEMKQKQIEQFLRETNKYFLDKEERTRSAIGKQAQLKYYANYKKLDKVLSKKKLNGLNNILPPIQQDPSTVVLQEVQNLGVLPCTMGFVKNKGQVNVISVKGQKFGDKYVKAISAGLKESKMIESCEFSNNRLTDAGFTEIIKNVGHQIFKLDFAHNSISKINQKLLDLIIEPQARLEYLNLENNLLSDKAVQSLCRSSTYSKHLKYLNLRKNLITKQSAEAISDLVLRTISLEELYIGINRICDEGAISIFESFEQNRTIKVLDYCMNKLGESKPSCAKALASVLATNKVLVHVDFSGNNFGEEESKIIADKLQGNKKIYGFHFSGNYGYIDSKGFLKVQKKDITTLHSIVQKNIHSYDIVFRRQPISLQPSKYKNVCWICEGWYEQTFKFTVPEPSPDDKNFVYIHFDFEEFQPRLINISDIKVKYKTMVPPRKYRYFYTWNNRQFVDDVKTYTQKNIVSEKNPINQISYTKIQMPMSYSYEMNHQQVTFQVQQVSCRSGKPKKIVDAWNELIVSVLPRQQGLVTKKQKKPWTYKDSLWAKQWKLDDEQFTKNCFEKDWKCSKLTNFIKNPIEQQKVKQILYKNYKLIKELYRYYSSWNPFNGDIWAVSGNAFTEFCYAAQIISKDTPLKIIDLTFITTNSISGADYKGNSLVPQRGLIRFQFMQGIVRLAEEKFKKNGLADSIFTSVINMIKDHIQPLQGNTICTNQKWRLQKYFCQQNDMLLKKYRPIFTDIYKKNSKMKVKPGNKPFMCLTQFKNIIERIGILGTLVLERDIFLSFNCSMMTQVDELESERFIRMTEIQFVQAIARCAFILPNTCKVQDIFGPTLPFYAKFQWIIHELKALCSQDIKSMFFGNTSLFNKSEDD